MVLTQSVIIFRQTFYYIMTNSNKNTISEREMSVKQTFPHFLGNLLYLLNSRKILETQSVITTWILGQFCLYSSTIPRKTPYGSSKILELQSVGKKQSIRNISTLQTRSEFQQTPSILGKLFIFTQSRHFPKYLAKAMKNSQNII